MTPPACTCDRVEHAPRLVVLTGGPGAGKTAVLEVARRELCKHVIVLPEAASILWIGGFPRRDTLAARRSAQRAIAHLQLELQRMAAEETRPSVILCDRGTLDGLAYWPDDPDSYFAALGSSRAAELARYATIVQLRPPTADEGYRAEGPRIETAEQAAAIDERISRAWAGHPRHFVVDSDHDFVRKMRTAIDLVRDEVPSCCRANAARSRRTRPDRGPDLASPWADPKGG